MVSRRRGVAAMGRATGRQCTMPTLGYPCVLVVEDDPHMREAVRLALATMDIDPVAVADGREALAWLARGERPALILLDLNMPGMNGWAFRAEQTRDRRLASIPVVLLTARGDLASQAERLDVAGAVSKPVDLDRLRDVVDRQLAR